MPVFVAIEAGGTKFICAHGNSPDTLEDRVRIETAHPEETMPALFDYIHSVQQHHEVASIGLACFGPLDLDMNSSSYGSITSTPKVAWQRYNIVNALKERFALPIGFDTDVNAAALGEQRWGAARDVDSLIYITVGTGIGVGVVIDGRLLHGALHPEAGHIRVPKLPDDKFQGVCPFHGDCLEGLASGPALKERWQVGSALDLPRDHPAWDMEAQYIAYAVCNYTLCYAPQRVVLGGGVMRQPGLIERIRPRLTSAINRYVQYPAVNQVDSYLVAAGLGDNAGIAGALALAERAVQR